MTIDAMRKCGASDNIISLIEAGYSTPEIINNEIITSIDLQWIMIYLPLSDEDMKNIRNKLNIDTISSNIFNSTDIAHSRFVKDGSLIYYSSFVNNSHDVTLSSYINTSNFVTNSEYIILSNNIEDSNHLKKSDRAVASSYCYSSSDLDEASYVRFSDSIENSSIISWCSDIADCYCLAFCKNCNHCLFCYGLEHKMYYIFNTPVPAEEYELLRETVLAVLSGYNIEAGGDWALRYTEKNIFDNIKPLLKKAVSSHSRYDDLVFETVL